MQHAVVTCKICGKSSRLDFDPHPCIHEVDHYELEMLNLATHSISDKCRRVHCTYHDVDESGVGAYRVCTDCGHAFADPDALLGYFPDRWIPASAIMHCPLCGARFRQRRLDLRAASREP